MTNEQGLLIGLCLDYVENQQKVKVSRAYSVLPHKTTHKGPYNCIKKGLTAKTKHADDEFDEELSELEKKFGPGLKNSIFNISPEDGSTNLCKEKCIFNQATNENSKPAVSIFPSEQKCTKRGLIKEINASDEEDSSVLPEPDFETRIKAGDGKGRRILLRVNLPGITSVQECLLDISKVKQ